MGEAKRKSKNLAEMVKTAERCIYCANPPKTVEHMPPRSLFSNRQRPSGLEFPACAECNNETKGADSAAAFFARISTRSDDTFWHGKEGRTLIHTVDRDAPGLREESMSFNLAKTFWARVPSGILEKKIVFRPNGPLLRAYLNVFSAKMGMVLYCEHVGHPLPLNGGVQVLWFLNGGLSEQRALGMLKILPMGDTLRQGKFVATTQFAYRYNCDEKSIFAALIGLHKNLHVFVIAAASPETFDLPKKVPFGDTAGGFFRPGDLVKQLAKIRQDSQPIASS